MGAPPPHPISGYDVLHKHDACGNDIKKHLYKRYKCLS